MNYDKSCCIGRKFKKESYSRKIANNMVNLFPEDYELEFVEIGSLPFIMKTTMQRIMHLLNTMLSVIK